ncbi:MAG: sn-glycerol-3-phosphate ABC transporter substrate-binding protein [Rhizobiales bacterium NRL2]|jgi:sn-glycerol 3-phosphate transport system substrate-binding protein|nr:MAG: sn-glycerol-3-phosphate ABC transporter substrate-binding protein [Rhizobiales bacterium NRL2]
MMKRIGAIAAAAMVFAGTAQAASEIEWWHAMGGKLGEKVEEIAQKFNASQDQFSVKPVYKGNYTETMTAAIAAFRAGEQPHVVQVFEVGTASMMAAKGAVYPVHELMADAGEAFDQSAYLPAVISYYTTPDGKLLSLPFNSSTPVLWYNKDLLDKAGVAEVPSTWGGIYHAAGKLQDAGHKCAISFGWQSWVMIENMSAWHDLPIGTKANGFEGTDTEFTFNNGTITGLLQRLRDSMADGTFKYGGRRGESLPLFTTGECAMWMNSSAYYASIKDQAEFAFGQAMLPYSATVVDKPQNSVIGGATLWVLRGHESKEYKGIAKFFKFMSSAEIQADWHQSTGYVPITTAAYELSKEQGYYTENPGTDTAIKQLSLNEPTENSKGLRFGNFVQIRDVINEEMEAIWAGQKDAKTALDDAKRRGDELLRKFERTN